MKSRFLLLLVLALCAPLRAATAPSLRDFFQPYLDQKAVAGAVTLVANKDGVLATEAFGFADLAQQRPMAPDTVFWIASQSKPMTATAFMMLVDEGKVSVDDPVEKYLPEFKGQQVSVDLGQGRTELRLPSRPVAVRDILSHTSGFRPKSPLEQPTLDGLPLRDAVRSHAQLPLLWEPGSKYLYSNAGINTAARIIEVVSGLAYEDFMRTRLFEPLGMKETTFWPTEAQVRRMAKVYKPNATKTDLEETPYDQLRYPLTDRTRFPIPAGGLFSTAADVARFARMLLNGGELDGRRYLSAAAVKTMTSKQTPAALKDGYGFGFTVGAREFGHGGARGTETSIDPSSGLITIFLIQQAGFIGDGAKLRKEFKRVAREKFGGGAPSAPEPATLATTTGAVGAQAVSREKPPKGKNREIIESQIIDIPADIKKEVFVYAKYDEEEIKLSVYTKEDLRNAPLIISIHGGGFSSGDENTMDSIAVSLVQHGYVVVSPTYRKIQPSQKNGGVESKWRIQDCVTDVSKALDWALANAPKYGADTRKIGVIGESAGAYLTYILGVSRPEVSCAVPMAGYSDFEKFAPGLAKGFSPAELENYSPLRILNKNTKAKFLVMHSKGDYNVAVENAGAFKKKADELNVPCDLVLYDYPDTHVFWFGKKGEMLERANEARTRYIKFFDYNLKK